MIGAADISVTMYICVYAIPLAMCYLRRGYLGGESSEGAVNGKIRASVADWDTHIQWCD